MKTMRLNFLISYENKRKSISEFYRDFRCKFSASLPEKLHLSVQRDFSRAIRLWMVHCVSSACSTGFFAGRGELSRALSRESTRPPSIGSGTNKLTWQLNVSRQRARIIARVSQRAHCAWRKNRLQARPPAASWSAAPCRRKSRLVSLHPQKGGKFVTFARRDASSSASKVKRICVCASESRKVRGKPTCRRT